MSSSARLCQIVRARSGPTPAGSPSVNARGCTNCFYSMAALLETGQRPTNRRLFVFDHRLPSEIGQIAVGLGAEPLFENLVADLLEAWGVGLRLFFRADREHLYAFRSLFRRCQMPNLNIVEDGAQRRRQIGGRFVDRVAHGDFRKPARERNPIGAARKTAA